MALTSNQIEILNYTIYRAANNHYCGDSPDMQNLVKLGLMKPVGRKSFVPDEFFTITAAGRKLLNVK